MRVEKPILEEIDPIVLKKTDKVCKWLSSSQGKKEIKKILIATKNNEKKMRECQEMNEFVVARRGY